MTSPHLRWARLFGLGQKKVHNCQTPCPTVRPNTERPVTIHQGTNRLVKSTTEVLARAIKEELDIVQQRERQVPERWDGHAAERIVGIFRKML